MSSDADLSRREREILNAVYRLGRASAAEIHAALKKPPTYTAVRTHLARLESKGLVRFTAEGKRYIYEPAIARDEMASDVLGGVVDTFFESKIELVVQTLLSNKEKRVTPEELERIHDLIQRAREEADDA